jgi:hypothetical protein
LQQTKSSLCAGPNLVHARPFGNFLKEFFGAVAIRAGAEFTSVVEGLALFALELA